MIKLSKKSIPVISILNNFYLPNIGLDSVPNYDEDERVFGLDFGSGWEGQKVCHLNGGRIEVFNKPYRRKYRWVNTLFHRSSERYSIAFRGEGSCKFFINRKDHCH